VRVLRSVVGILRTFFPIYTVKIFSKYHRYNIMYFRSYYILLEIKLRYTTHILGQVVYFIKILFALTLCCLIFAQYKYQIG